MAVFSIIENILNLGGLFGIIKRKLYIRSTMADVKEEELSTLLRQAWQWYCLYGEEK